MNYKNMSDYQLCCLRNEPEVISVLWERYQRLIFKYSHKVYKNLKFNVEFEDILQDYNEKFINAVYNVKFNKIKDKKKFSLMVYLPHVFSSFKKNLNYKYIYELNTNSVFNRCDIFNSFEFYDMEFIDKKNEIENNYLFDYLKTKLEPKEYEIILRVFILKEKKYNVAKDLNMLPSLFTHHFQRTLKKIRNILSNEKVLLFD